MTKFVYISDEYRQAWVTFLLTRDVDNANSDSMGWYRFSDSFIEEFNYKFQEERHLLEKYTRPKDWFLNDMEGKEEYLFNMSQNFYPKVKYEYTEDLPSFSDMMINRAEELRDMGKEIELFYSGGMDSVAVLLALIEVCPSDQIRVIMGGYPGPVQDYPDMYKKVISQMPNVNMNCGDLFGQAKIDKSVFTTGSEADMLWGAVGYTLITLYAQYDPSKPLGYTIDRSKPGNLAQPEAREWNNGRWYEKFRRLQLTESWRFLRNLHVNRVDMDNYQPFFLHPMFERHAINMHMEDRMFYYIPSPLDEHKEEYKKAKMMVRDFIFEKTKDRDYAYGVPKTVTHPNVQTQCSVPLQPNYTVLAITEDGTIVNRENIMEYMTANCLTIDE